MGDSMLTVITQSNIKGNGRMPTTDSKSLELFSFVVARCKTFCRGEIKGYANDSATASLEVHHLLSEGRFGQSLISIIGHQFGMPAEAINSI